MGKEQVGREGFPRGCFPLVPDLLVFCPAGHGEREWSLSGCKRCVASPGADRGAEGSRAGTACGLREEPAGQNHRQSTHNHAGCCCRTIHLYPSDPASTHGVEHKAPMDRGWGQLCEAGVTLLWRAGSARQPSAAWALVVLGPGCASSGFATWPLPAERVRPLAATITP